MASRFQRTRDSLGRSFGRFGALALLASGISQSAAAQQSLQFNHLTTDGGLSAAWVSSIYRDSRGFMWFGTHNGLNRYDGYTVTAFRHQRGDSTSLAGNFVEFITEDRDSVLWVGTSLGISRFDRNRNIFTNVLVGAGAGSPAIRMLQLRSGITVLASTGALYQFDHATTKSRPYLPSANATFGGKPIMALAEDRRGHVWAGTNGSGLIDVDPATGATKTYSGTATAPGNFPDDDIRDLVIDGDGILWVGTYHAGLVRLDPATGAITRLQNDPKSSNSLAINAIQKLTLNGTRGLWIGLDHGGLDRLDLTSGVITHNPVDANDPMGLNSGSVWAVYEDKEGTLWVGTFSGGVNIAKRNSGGIRAYHTIPDDTTSLSANSVVAFAQDSSGAIWVGTDGGGLNRLDLPTNRFTRYTSQNGRINKDAVLGITAEPDGTIWIAMWNGGIARLDPVTKRYTAYTMRNSNIPSDNMFAIHIDRRGRVWVGSWKDGLLLFDRQTKSFTAYSVNDTEEQSQVWIIHELHDGRLALGTLQQGVRIFDPETKTMTHIRSDVKDRNSLPTDEIRAIREGAPGILWIGTGEGLDRLDLKTRRFTHFTAADGIVANAVSGIAIDSGGNLWLSTDQGVTRFNPEQRTASHYTTADGLQGRDFTSRAYLQARSGMLLFGGNEGFNIIRPGALLQNTSKPRVAITGFQLLNKPVVIGVPGSPLERDISETRELTLSYLQSVFTFEFAALDYAAPSKNQYAYMLEGFDDTWTHANAKRSVTYTGLPAGHYVFRVKASNGDGVWNDDGTSVRLTITPPFWRTLWFRALVALVVAGCVAIIVLTARTRHLYLKKVNARLAESAEHDREQQRYLEGNVLDILGAMQKFSEGDYSVALAVQSDDAIGDLRKGFNDVVADLKRAEEELRQSQKMEAVGRLAGGVAHDFNNLLTVIVGNTALALQEADPAGPGIEELREIQRAAVRASALTRQLLAFSRKQILQPRIFSLNDVARDLGQMLDRTLGEDIDLQIVTEPQLANLHADPGQIERVLMNLVMNARDAMPRGGTLLIRTRTVDAEEASTYPESDEGTAYVELVVRDSGTGMSDGVKQRIFEPFFTTKEQGKGTGLGLSTAYGIVKQSGGFIRVESEIGQGTTVAVYLPQAAGTSDGPQRSALSPVPRGSATVLLVEDEDSVRGLASRVLERGGYTVLTASNGEAALAMSAGFTGDIDLLLTDVVMPGMSGRELAERLVLTRTGMRVLFASGYTEDAILRHGVSSEAVAFLAKPFTPDDLLRKVQFALESPTFGEPAEVS